jgi:hypothetical protein
MMSIGAGELVVMAIIGLVVIVPPIAVLVWLLKKSGAKERPPPQP